MLASELTATREHSAGPDMVRGPNEFFLPGGRSGVLLIHGLTGTPSEMRFVGNGLNRAGFTVYGMQLAGHCGDESTLVATGWHDWVTSVEAALDRLRLHVDQVFVAGLSMGAVLALLVAARQPDQVKGLALYGTTLAYDGWTIPWFARFAFLLPLAIGLGIGRNRRFVECHPFGIKDERIRRRIVEFMSSGNSGAAGLLGNPWPALAEFYGLARHVRRQLKNVRAPCLIVHAVEDDVASVRNARYVAEKVNGPVQSLWLHDSYHMVTIDRQRQLVASASADFFREWSVPS